MKDAEGITIGLRWERSEKSSVPLCFRCDKDMRGYFGYNIAHRREWSEDEMLNECTLIFDGGYGSFIDVCGGSPNPAVTICHECAHELAEWLGVDVRKWHTHVPGYQHPDHHDYDGVCSRQAAEREALAVRIKEEYPELTALQEQRDAAGRRIREIYSSLRESE